MRLVREGLGRIGKGGGGVVGRVYGSRPARVCSLEKRFILNTRGPGGDPFPIYIYIYICDFNSIPPQAHRPEQIYIYTPTSPFPPIQHPPPAVSILIKTALFGVLCIANSNGNSPFFQRLS